MPSSRTLDQLDVAVDDPRAVANAGLLPAALTQRLGIQRTADQLFDLGERPGAAHPGRKLLTLVHAMLAGADGIDDADLLRAAPPAECSATTSWRPPPWAGSCAGSPSATSASSTGSPSRSSRGQGGRRRPRRWAHDHRPGLHGV